MIMVHSTFSLIPETRKDVLALMEKMVVECRKEPGCISYEYFSGITDPCQVMLVQEWKSSDFLQLHYQTPHMEEFVQQLGNFLESPVVTQSYATPDELVSRAEKSSLTAPAAKTIH